MTLRVTHRSLYANNLGNLQQNLSRLQRIQDHLSSGKQVRLPSDSPAGVSAALQHRAAITRDGQFTRNADDGTGWLTSADSSLTDAVSTMGRVRELLVQAANTGTGTDAARAAAEEVDALRELLLATANRQYLGRPIFAGTADTVAAYAPDGTYQGNAAEVRRSVRPGVEVQVNITGPEVFGPAGNDVFAFLTTVADHMRNNQGALSGDIATADTFLAGIRDALSTIGARYNQVDTMKAKNEEDLLLSKQQLSEIEDIDLPATIVELQLQETAYQAALSATSRSIQPSLLDFLR